MSSLLLYHQQRELKKNGFILKQEKNHTQGEDTKDKKEAEHSGLEENKIEDEAELIPLEFSRPVKEEGSSSEVMDEDDEADDDETQGKPSIKISVTQDGLVLANQIEDYLFRGDTLKEMCFYDFIRTTKKVSNKEMKGTQRDRKYLRHVFKAGHSQNKTKELEQFADPATLLPEVELVPKSQGG
ncbi:hypothetical protein BOTBODRAFT_182518 [Botryobasidium botryosum FD-172 SS1]|uniref:Uncharacterized protein n=1 Tax=Botryobasidium botryosum (strain FD-172 SS1) TaxID=930990 RepID=A0A067LR82_BOTB1|nr:hypothetical protein BOTBODRAFT_182518 [Botryobasidium botryosum FD-172 SS1]